MKKQHLICLLFTLLAFSGCKKDEESPKSGQKSTESKIISFKFNSLSPATEGIVDDNSKTISVELPGSTNLTNLLPTITISEKATISPASSTVTDFSNPVKYTVTSENGDKSEYTVTVSKLGPSIAIRFVDPLISNADTISNLRDDVEWNSMHWIIGKNFSKTQSDNKVFLVNSVGTAFEMTLSASDSIHLGFLIPETTPLGTGYKIKVMVKTQETVFNKAVKVTMPSPEIASVNKTSLTIGDSLTITGKYFGTDTTKTSVIFRYNNHNHKGKFVSITDGQLVVKTPENIVPNKYTVVVSRDGKETSAPDKVTVGSANKIVVTDINKTRFKRGEVITFYGKNFIKDDKSAYIIFTKSGAVNGELRFGSSNAEGTMLTFTIPSDFEYATYDILVSIDLKEYTEVSQQLVVEP